MCSWGEYIDESLIDEFEAQTGIEVNYRTAPSNEELYSTLQSGGTSYDVIVPSDYMISQLIEEDMLQPLDYSKIPNFEKIDDRFKNLSYDPENLYTVPYTWGTLGIIYNTTMVDEPITSWERHVRRHRPPATCCSSTTPGTPSASPCTTWATR